MCWVNEKFVQIKSNVYVLVDEIIALLGNEGFV
jgi:hypothetical protein